MAHAYLQESWDTAAAGDELAVTGEEARHAVTVARLRIGERITLLNGRGARVVAEVRSISPTEFIVRAVEDAVLEPAPTPRIVLVQALAKGGRDELAVQAAVELGVDEVIPWQANRSISKWSGDKALKQRRRWQAIAREAAKQSLRARVPEIAEAVTSRQLSGGFPGGVVLLLAPDGARRLGELARHELAEADAVTLVVGPEGGIDAAEIESFTAAGAHPVRLGDTVLRTSTAGPAAIAALLTRLQRW